MVHSFRRSFKLFVRLALEFQLKRFCLRVELNTLEHQMPINKVSEAFLIYTITNLRQLIKYSPHKQYKCIMIDWTSYYNRTRRNYNVILHSYSNTTVVMILSGTTRIKQVRMVLINIYSSTLKHPMK